MSVDISPGTGDQLVVPLSPDNQEWVSFRPGGSGWALYRSDRFDAERSWLFLRFASADDPADDPAYDNLDVNPGVRRSNFVYPGEGVLVPETHLPQFIEVRDVLVSFRGGGIAARILRDIPLTRIEAAVNQPAYRDRLLHRLRGRQVAMQPFVWDKGKDADWWFAVPHPYVSPKIAVEVPSGRSRPDEFYEAVAAAYAYLATVSSRPAAEMADANDVPVSTIHGWVKEARRRGFLPAGERKRGA